MSLILPCERSARDAATSVPPRACSPAETRQDGWRSVIASSPASNRRRHGVPHQDQDRAGHRGVSSSRPERRRLRRALKERVAPAAGVAKERAAQAKDWSKPHVEARPRLGQAARRPRHRGRRPQAAGCRRGPGPQGRHRPRHHRRLAAAQGRRGHRGRRRRLGRRQDRPPATTADRSSDAYSVLKGDAVAKPRRRKGKFLLFLGLARRGRRRARRVQEVGARARTRGPRRSTTPTPRRPPAATPVSSKVASLADAAKDKASSAAETVKDKAADAKDKATEAASDAKDKVTCKGQHAAGDAADGVQDAADESPTRPRTPRTRSTDRPRACSNLC